MLEYIVNIIVTSYNALITTTKWLVVFGILLFFSMCFLIIRVKIEKSFERWLHKAKTKEWHKRLMLFIHGEDYYAEYKLSEIPIIHNKRKAEIKYGKKYYIYKKISNEIKLLDLLIEASGEIVTFEEVAIKLDMPRSHEVGTTTTGYRKDIYELVSRLRSLMIKELKIKKSELNQLILTVKDIGYRLGNPNN